MRVAAIVIAAFAVVAARSNPDYKPEPKPLTPRQAAMDFACSESSSVEVDDYQSCRDMILYTMRTQNMARLAELYSTKCTEHRSTLVTQAFYQCPDTTSFRHLLTLFNSMDIDHDIYTRAVFAAAFRIDAAELLPFAFEHALQFGNDIVKIDQMSAKLALEPHLNSFHNACAFRALVAYRGRTEGISAGVRSTASERGYNNDIAGTNAILEYIQPELEAFGDVAGSLVANAARLGEVQSLTFVLDRIHHSPQIAQKGINKAIQISVPSRFNYPDDGTCLFVLLARFGSDPAFIQRGLRGALYAAVRKHNLSALREIVSVLAKGDRSLGGKALIKAREYATLSGNDLMLAVLAPLL